MTDIVRPTAPEVAHAASEWMTATLAALPGRLAVSLSGGSTPKLLYEILARPPFAARMPWDRVHWFWGDERFVPEGDPRSNQRMVREAMLDHVPVPPGHIHPVPTAGLSAAAAAAAYDAELRKFAAGSAPLFDLVLLGLGTNGHTASLFPDEPALQERDRWALDVAPPGEPVRITLTWPPLENCRHAAFLVVGAEKRDVVARVKAGEPDLPASHYRPHGDLHWWLDDAASGA